MKIVKPRIYLVSRPSVDWEQIAAFLADENPPPMEKSIRAGEDQANAIIETSARLCYMSFGRGRRHIADFTENLLRSKDGSVLEHVNYGFVATGISRSLSHELVRHRAGFAYSQRSQRYVDESEMTVVLPPALERPEAAEAVRNFNAACRHIEYAYAEMAESLGHMHDGDDFGTATDRRKATRQAARSVLPNATETKMFITANARAWRHFIEMRGSAAADPEIRRLALMVLDVLSAEAPLLFGDFAIEELPDGSRTATPKYSKV